MGFPDDGRRRDTFIALDGESALSMWRQDRARTTVEEGHVWAAEAK